MIFLGELNLSGSLVPISGVFPMLAKAAEAGYCMGIVPRENAKEASIVPRMQAQGVSHLKEAVAYLNGKEVDATPYNIEEKERKKTKTPDFSEINGQKVLKRACEIAVAGRHNLLMIGPPRSRKNHGGKTDSLNTSSNDQKGTDGGLKNLQ